jgi:hypothetical protein
MPVGTEIGIADALAAGAEHDPRGRRVIEQVAVMLLARDAYSAGVDLGKSFHVCGRVVDRNATQWRFRQTGHHPFARGAKKISRHLGKQAVPDVEALRDTVERESNQRLVGRS